MDAENMPVFAMFVCFFLGLTLGFRWGYNKGTLNISKFGIGGSMKGFTLIELMIVVSIIGILVAVIVPACSDGSRKNGRFHSKCINGTLHTQSFGNPDVYVDTEKKCVIDSRGEGK